MTIDEILKLVNKHHQELAEFKKEMELNTNNLKSECDQNTHFNKRLIAALLACEETNDLTLLPSGEFYGQKI